MTITNGAPNNNNNSTTNEATAAVSVEEMNAEDIALVNFQNTSQDKQIMLLSRLMQFINENINNKVLTKAKLILLVDAFSGPCHALSPLFTKQKDLVGFVQNILQQYAPTSDQDINSEGANDNDHITVIDILNEVLTLGLYCSQDNASQIICFENKSYMQILVSMSSLSTINQKVLSRSVTCLYNVSLAPQIREELFNFPGFVDAVLNPQLPSTSTGYVVHMLCMFAENIELGKKMLKNQRVMEAIAKNLASYQQLAIYDQESCGLTISYLFIDENAKKDLTFKYKIPEIIVENLSTVASASSVLEIFLSILLTLTNVNSLALHLFHIPNLVEMLMKSCKDKSLNAQRDATAAINNLSRIAEIQPLLRKKPEVSALMSELLTNEANAKQETVCIALGTLINIAGKNIEEQIKVTKLFSIAKAGAEVNGQPRSLFYFEKLVRVLHGILNPSVGTDTELVWEMSDTLQPLSYLCLIEQNRKDLAEKLCPLLGPTVEKTIISNDVDCLGFALDILLLYLEPVSEPAFSILSKNMKLKLLLMRLQKSPVLRADEIAQSSASAISVAQFQKKSAEKLLSILFPTNNTTQVTASTASPASASNAAT